SHVEASPSSRLGASLLAPTRPRLACGRISRSHLTLQAVRSLPAPCAVAAVYSLGSGWGRARGHDVGADDRDDLRPRHGPGDGHGSVASVSGEDVHAVPKANAIEAIKGRVPGVDIVTSGNNPGDGISIRIRGTRSLTASNDPLYVLDGIPMAGGIGDLNPSDIESIEILK